jgi:pyruvate dehydrogenase E1 component beta subunit
LIRDAIYKAISVRMHADSSIYIFGEGAHMKIHFDAPGIEKEFAERVVTLPISEDGNTNFALGASLVGIKPIVDVISSDFLFRTMDSICNTAVKLNHASTAVGRPKTIVIKSEFMFGGPTSGQRLESMFAHIPGLNVVVPSNPKDAQGLMNASLSHPGVTVFFEDRMISDADTKASDSSIDDEFEIPLGRANLRRKGNSLTVVSYAVTLRRLESLMESKGYDCDLIDIRSLFPLDYSSIIESVSATGCLLIVEPDVLYGGVGGEIGATVAERCFTSLKKPIRRIGAPRGIIPVSMDRHNLMLPSMDDVAKVIESMLA